MTHKERHALRDRQARIDASVSAAGQKAAREYLARHKAPLVSPADVLGGIAIAALLLAALIILP